MIAVPKARRCFQPPDRFLVISRSRPLRFAIPRMYSLRWKPAARDAIGAAVEVKVLGYRHVVVEA